MVRTMWEETQIELELNRFSINLVSVWSTLRTAPFVGNSKVFLNISLISKIIRLECTYKQDRVIVSGKEWHRQCWLQRSQQLSPMKASQKNDSENTINNSLTSPPRLSASGASKVVRFFINCHFQFSLISIDFSILYHFELF